MQYHLSKEVDMDRKNVTWLSFIVAACFCSLGVVAFGDEADINAVSLEDLLNTKISTAAKYEQTTSQAPASVTIITSEASTQFPIMNAVMSLPPRPIVVMSPFASLPTKPQTTGTIPFFICDIMCFLTSCRVLRISGSAFP